MPTRSEQREATRVAVLAAAEGVFLEYGYEAASIRAIADAAGVSVGTVMSVGDKRALLAAVFDRGVSLVDERRRRERGVAPSGTGEPEMGGGIASAQSPAVADRIVALVEPYVRLFAGRAELARTYGAVLMSGRHDSAVFGELADRLTVEIEREIRGDDNADSGAQHPDPATAAHAVYLTYLGALFAFAGSGGDDPRALLDDLRSAIEAIVPRRDGGGASPTVKGMRP